LVRRQWIARSTAGSRHSSAPAVPGYYFKDRRNSVANARRRFGAYVEAREHVEPFRIEATFPIGSPVSSMVALMWPDHRSVDAVIQWAAEHMAVVDMDGNVLYPTHINVRQASERVLRAEEPA
jgi:hypothetical protein